MLGHPAWSQVPCDTSWTGGAGTDDWHSPGNWNGGVPSAGEDVCIPASRSARLWDIAEAASVKVDGTLTIQSGTLEGATVSGAGTVSWSGGTLDDVTIAAGTTVTYSGGGYVTGAFTVSGTLDVTAGKILAGADGTTITTTATGTVNLSGTYSSCWHWNQCGFANDHAYADTAFVNDGTITQTGGINQIGLPFHNNGGTVNVAESTLILTGSHPQAHTGTFTTTPNGYGSVNFTGGTHNLTTTTITPGSTIYVDTTGVVAGLTELAGDVNWTVYGELADTTRVTGGADLTIAGGTTQALEVDAPST